MPKSLRTPLFVLICAASIGVGWRPLLETIHLAWTDDAYTHILLILPLSVALIYLDSRALQINHTPSARLGLAFFLLAAVLGLIAWRGIASGPDHVRFSLSILALVICWFGAIVFCFGIKTVQAFLFPLCFLFLIVPIPDFALTRIVEFLQYQSAFAARVLFRLANVPATQDGIVISIPGLDLEVAAECSSIRSSLILLVTTALMAHLFLRSWWRKALLIAAAIPLSVVKNGLRIFTIAELGTRVDRGFLNGKLHHNGGILFWALAVLAMLTLLWMLRNTERPTGGRPDTAIAFRN